MVTDANSIIAQALENAGVPPQNISVPEEPESEQARTPSLDGLPKGEVKGQQKIEETPEPKPKPSEPESAEPIAPQLSKVEIEAAITEATSKFQSLIDRKIHQLGLSIQQQSTALNQFFSAQEEASIASLTPEEQLNKRLEKLEKGGNQPKIQIANQPIDQQPAQYVQMLVNFVDAVGLKVDDKRIDWAGDTNDPVAGSKRFFDSIKKTLVEDQTNAIKELRENGTKEIAKLRKKTGVDRVGNSGPGGQGAQDISKMTPMEKIEYGFQQQEQLSQVAK